MLPRSQFPSQASRRWLSRVTALLDLTSSPIKPRLLEAGWCPGDIGRVLDSFYTIANIYYFSNFKPDPKNTNLHRACQLWGCTLNLPPEPQHVVNECNCPGMMTFPEETLVNIYESGNIPCFSIGRLETGSLAIAFSSISIDPEAQKDEANHYVALSHVWSEGMGNPHANSLPLCRLAQVQHWGMLAMQIVQEKEEALARDNRSASGIHTSTVPKVKQVNLWIDTMCCPSTPGYGKNLCLARMRDIYSHAYAVLVRTTTLEQFSVDKYLDNPAGGVMDLAAQLYLSPWMRRMWTLQEGVLAGYHKGRGIGDRLVLGYRGGLMTLESLVSLLKQAPKHEAVPAFDFLGKFAALGPRLWNLEDDDDYRGDRPAFFSLEVLSNALKFRGLSVPSDEVVILATLLGLRVKTSHGSVPLIEDGKTLEDGLCELWRRVEDQNGGIPGDIIFSPVPRVRVQGFRWAPRTFVQHGRYGRLYSSTRNPAHIVGDGLQVRFLGAMLRLSDSSGTYGRYLLKSQLGAGDDTVPQDSQRDKPTQVLIVQIPAGGDNWYAVHISRRDGQAGLGGVLPANDDARLDPYELLKSESCALLFKELRPLGNALFATIKNVTTTGNEGQRRLEVCTEYTASVSPLSPGASLISSAAQSCVGRVHTAIAAEAVQRGNTTPAGLQDDADFVLRLLRRTAMDIIAEVPGLTDALYHEALAKRASVTEEKVVENFMRYVDKVAKCGGVEGELTADNQLWCID
jgi:hypothetical protein